MNVVLTGMRGTGKSSVGVALAAQLGYTFLDTDQAIEAQAGLRIAEIVEQFGWDRFRALEREVVDEIAVMDGHVVAAGGGTLIDEHNAERLKSSGVVVLLTCELAILQRRIGGEGNRPSLTGQGSAVAELSKVWEDRRDRYLAVADLIYDVSVESGDVPRDIAQHASAICQLLHEHGDVASGPETSPVSS